MKRRHARQWFEEYRCECVSLYVERKRELLGYCPVHGETRRHAWRVKLDPGAGKEEGHDES